MAWQNIFQLGECDVYVQWQDYDNSGLPGASRICLAADLPSAIGTVEVIDNEVVCNFNYNPGGSSGYYPKVYVAPKFDYSAAIDARVIEVSAEGDLIPDNSADNYIGRACTLYELDEAPGEFDNDFECPGYAQAFMGTIPPDENGFVYGAAPGPIPPLAAQVPGDIPVIGVTYYSPGF
jgi:hypothetical protein